jgi:Cu/Ag efflux protein CusF
MPPEQTTDNNPPELPAAAPNQYSSHRRATGTKLERFKGWYGERKKWTIPATLLLLIILLAAVPFTRYNLAGLALKKDLTVKVLDSETNTPVSGADVTLGNLSAQTNSAGQATLRHVKVGHHKITISKKYYKDMAIDELAPILRPKSTASIQLVATGRQVKVTITNLINQNPIADAKVSVAGSTAKTDSNGTALVVLPADSTEHKATISADGYNDSKVTIKVGGDQIPNEKFRLTPDGKVYFLSKLSGKIDVVKTNLDGTDRQTVLAGTGNEDDRNTVLLASRDWKYLALLSRRAGNNPTLYVINTGNDGLTTVEQGSANISLTGWSGSNFVYTLTHSDVQLWQPGRQVLKSYNAITKKTTTLDQTTASGSGSFDYLSQLVGNVYAYDDQVYYIMNWTAAFGSSLISQLQTKQATFNSIKPDGSAKKSIHSFGLASGTQSADITLDESVKSPKAVELHLFDGVKDNYYVYADGQVKNDPSANSNNFFSTYPTYLLSPSGDKTFWSEPRDGKNTLFVGDEEGENGKQIAALSDYNTYGWYTDSYLLVSKNSSELYVMDNAGKQTPVKISDYHKPAQTFTGYGGGYGGI